MPVLGIAACGMLEDELAHVLCSDRDLKHLLLIDGPEILGLAGKLSARRRSHLVIDRRSVPDHLENIRRKSSPGFLMSVLNKIAGPSFSFRRAANPRNSRGHNTVVVVDILEKALHSDEKLLKDEVYKSVRNLAEFSDSVLVFFGLCGNALADMEEDLGQLACRLHFLADADGRRIDDCIAAALGGNSEYERVLSSFPGVGIFFTPMWAYHWQEIDREVRRVRGSSTAKSRGLGRMLKELGYSRVARLDTGLGFISDFEVESKINDFAAQHRLEVVHLTGGPELVERCYQRARDDMAERV